MPTWSESSAICWRSIRWTRRSSPTKMAALYGSGRPGQALGLYRDIRSRLIEELGTEPGPLLSDLHLRILRHDPSLAARPAARRPAGGHRPTRFRPRRRSSWAAARS